MPIHLTPGRYRGLRGTSTPNNVFNILAFDQRGSYRKMLPSGTSYADALQIKQEVIVALSDAVSAVLLDNQYGIPPAMHMRGGCGLLLSLEESGYSGDSTYRRLMFHDAWTVEKIKRTGATAVKLMAYYHPHSGALAEEIEAVISNVVAECQKHDIPVFLEPMSYSLDASISKESAEYAATRAQVVIDTARRLSPLGADVLKLEFPIDAAFDQDQARWQATCEEVSRVCSIPWVLLSAGVDFETFTVQTEIACKAGASGWLAGRAIWKECATMTTAERATFLKDVAIPRSHRLNAIAAEFARPWTDFYAAPQVTETWFTSY
ncbi:MAG: tagatose 1,6-diphosphate aldolase [Phototrophicaceae bacterium]